MALEDFKIDNFAEPVSAMGENPAWRVGTISIGYSTVLKGINPYYINTWQSIS